MPGLCLDAAPVCIEATVFRNNRSPTTSDVNSNASSSSSNCSVPVCSFCSVRSGRRAEGGAEDAEEAENEKLDLEQEDED